MKITGFLLISILLQLNTDAQSARHKNIVQLIFTSDANYGIKRKKFRNDTAVDGRIVNAAMIREINSISSVRLPLGKGVNNGQITGPVDYLIEGGDIANRMEIPDQSDAASWKEFCADYISGFTLTNRYGKKSGTLIIPGNHDITNAIGFYRPMKPVTDATSMAGIYNMMMKPLVAVDAHSYDYTKNKINYSKNISGIHFMFINLWPDSSERIWMKRDLAGISSKVPVIIFAHDQPECEAKHFTNPDKSRGINKDDKFENLLGEVYKEASTTLADGGKTYIEQQGWVNFLKKHSNIKAYFHGNDNFNEFYNYQGPLKDISLPVFRVDSPMKGEYSSGDETKLSFQLISIDTKTLTMTVRECLWNTRPAGFNKSITWGASKTISLVCK
jgi:hypothetical protein